MRMVLDPNQLEIVKVVKDGEFYGGRLYNRSIILPVELTLNDIQDLFIVFNNDLKTKLAYNASVNRYGGNSVYNITINEEDQELSFRELTDGVLI